MMRFGVDNIDGVDRVVLADGDVSLLTSHPKDCGLSRWPGKMVGQQIGCMRILLVWKQMAIGHCCMVNWTKGGIFGMRIFAKEI